MQFLRTFPSVVKEEAYFKSFEPLFAHGIDTVNWKEAETQMKVILMSHFIFDPAQFNDTIKKMFANDICFFVSIKNQKTNEVLGFITFMIRANYIYGDIKVMSVGVLPSHQGTGLGKLLMSSILAIIPTAQRIFLCTRVTNENAIMAYKHWGFIPDHNPVLDHPFNLAYWSFLEYKTNKYDILQQAADTLIE